MLQTNNKIMKVTVHGEKGRVLSIHSLFIEICTPSCAAVHKNFICIARSRAQKNRGYHKIDSPLNLSGVPTGIRTRVTGVKGRKRAYST